MPEPGSPCLPPRAADPSALGFEHIRYERDTDAGVATVTIDRPDVLNALDFPTLKELSRAFEEASWDDRWRWWSSPGPGTVLLHRR